MKYGEAWLKMKESAKLVNGELVMSMPYCEKRMPRGEAGEYYTRKINRYFKRAGYEMKKPDTFEDDMNRAFIRVRKNTNEMIRRGALQLRKVTEATSA